MRSAINGTDLGGKSRLNLVTGVGVAVSGGSVAGANDWIDVGFAVDRESQAPTPAATISLDVSSGKDILAAWTSGEAETVNLTGAQTAGQRLTLLILNGPTTARVITLGTGIVGKGTITGTADKSAVATFISNGTSFFEIARTLILG